jgi:hypothetical protein
MVMKRTPNGTWYQEPPYTAAEEAEFYRRMSGGPVTILRPAPPKPSVAPKQKLPPLPER